MSDNVCKFNPIRSGDMVCPHFVYEVMGNQATPSRAKRNAMHLVIEGEGVYTCEGHAHPISRGCVFFLRAGDEFSVLPTTQLKYCYVSFQGRRAEEYLQRLRVFPDSCTFERYERLIPFWLEAHEMAEEGNIDLFSEAVLLYTLGVLKPQHGAKSDATDLVAELTQSEFTDPDLSITVIAARLGYDAKYLSSLFKRKRGISYTAYLRDLRLRHAAGLIMSGYYSLREVAYMSGYNDYKYFSTEFKKAMGVSPSEYQVRGR